MTPFSELLSQGASNAWLFVPSAILLGALHGLEPGHSKTMMAAFIIAVRGTVMQAVLLGLAATVSHTAVVWLVALVGLHYGSQWNTETTEPYFQIASAALIIAIALWMLWRTWRDLRAAKAHTGHHHDHGDETREIDTGHGVLTLEIFEDGIPPHWRVRFRSGHGFAAGEVSVETIRQDGSTQTFTFTDKSGYLESTVDIPEPHEFKARVTLSHGDHGHSYETVFQEHHHHHGEGLDEGSDEYQDAHERAHALDIQKRFADRKVTTWQIILFGLTGGLIPCPASITILILCLQLKQFVLGAALVLCFSIGLAITMVTVGAAAAISVNHVSKRWAGFSEFARRAPYVSSVLIIGVGLYTGYIGWAQLVAHGA